jgi:hypothetical protein
MRGLCPRLRNAALLGCVLALSVPSAALGTNYWGYNWISSSNPTGQCADGAGTACVSTSSSSSQADKLDTGASCVWVGYRGANGIQWCSKSTQTISAFASTGHDPATGAKCKWDSGGASYIQCRYFNGFGPEVGSTGNLFGLSSPGGPFDLLGKPSRTATRFARKASSPLATAGTSVAIRELPTSMRVFLTENGFAGDLRLLSVVGSLDGIYTYRNRAGGLCVATSLGAQCPQLNAQLLDSGPVAAMIAAKEDDRAPIVWWRGVVRNAVKTVVVVDASGARLTGKPVNHSFDIEGPIARPATLQALNRLGRVIWSQKLD